MSAAKRIIEGEKTYRLRSEDILPGDLICRKNLWNKGYANKKIALPLKIIYISLGICPKAKGLIHVHIDPDKDVRGISSRQYGIKPKCKCSLASEDNAYAIYVSSVMKLQP